MKIDPPRGSDSEDGKVTEQEDMGARRANQVSNSGGPSWDVMSRVGSSNQNFSELF